MEKILIVDDDKAIAELISDALEDENLQTAVCGNGLEALQVIENNRDFDLIILDIMMPEMNGIELCKRIRDIVACPILFVTAKSRTLDAMLGFELGGDDYIFKPFVVEELVARVKAHIRREQRHEKRQSKEKLTIGDIEIRRDNFETYICGKPVALSTREFQLLQFLMENAGHVLAREQIFNAVWGIDYGDIGTVNVNIKNLREKIDPDNEYIKTIWGIGYKFIKPQTRG
ncbi:DNA-binding response OmpR family regulator [Ruminiclostridium sufflavum DSM 19573]|uniref:Stage 0 sporulation protein A homolog n=1 Tax=Ruminiclostridium sufflavum DSM 19573 TaxID=1121337 RepID=A0A318Y9T9_9FIRM|nr:response regulator transcription factor [Ruminiclostridium sufflavum]PYG89153.1 DNA-binding response OmpR family regulator [Ruminiclostridium sufflavum DSM 19573]